MLEDNEFADLIHKRYFELRKTILGQAFTDNIIDSVATLLNEAQTRHFQKWNTLGLILEHLNQEYNLRHIAG